jgi:uncharacterized protein YehS (DUF1456 family)
MDNNDVLRRVRYIFDFNDAKMMAIFSLADHHVSREEVSDWLKKEGDADYKELSDVQMAAFLNGLITDKRGPRDGPKPVAEKRLTNNIVFMKLKIAMNLKAEEVMAILALAGFTISKHELSAFFRKVDHKHYRVCKDQILRYFLKGLQLKLRGTSDEETAPVDQLI